MVIMLVDNMVDVVVLGCWGVCVVLVEWFIV